MNLRAIATFSTLALAAAAAASAATGPNLVTNGSFNPSGSGSPDLGGWTDLYGPDSNNLIGLRSTVGNHFGQGTPVVNLATDPDGGSFLSVYRGGYYPEAGVYTYTLPNYTQGVSQQIDNLTVGHVYQLSFYAAATTIYKGDTTPMNWQVSFEGQTKTSANIAPGAFDERDCDSCGRAGIYTTGSFTKTTMTFTANSTSSLLKFAAALPLAPNNPSNYSIYLDGISLVDLNPTPAVPEPNMAALSLVGLLTLGTIARRRRSARQ